MRVIVCGGRDYQNRNRVYTTLDVILKNVGKDALTIIQGGAQGADRLAVDWALLNNVEVIQYPADWQKYGKRAGYIRNKQMLDEGKADYVIAFPGGPGTKMMTELAQKANVKVVVIN